MKTKLNPYLLASFVLAIVAYLAPANLVAQQTADPDELLEFRPAPTEIISAEVEDVALLDNSQTTTIKFEEKTYDFVKVKEGEVVTHTFTFTNTGTEPLVISNARGSCGCTVPQWPKEPIMPGETGAITVDFNSKNKSGKRSQKVTITANTNPAESFLHLTGFVLEESKTKEDYPIEIPTMYPEAAVPTAPVGPITTIEFKETEYDFGNVEEGTLVSQVFTFTNTGTEPLVISDAKGSCGCTVPQWPRGPITPGETASLTVEFNSKNKRGKRSQRVTITANTNPPQTFLSLVGHVDEREEIEEENLIPDFAELEIQAEAEEPAPNCFAVFPNPTAEVLSLEMKSYAGKEAIISIYSMTGALMAQREVFVETETIEFYVDHYPAGTYMANVQTAGEAPESRCFVVVD